MPFRLLTKSAHQNANGSRLRGPIENVEKHILVCECRPIRYRMLSRWVVVQCLFAFLGTVSVQGRNAAEDVKRRIDEARTSDGLNVLSALYPNSNFVISPFSISASLRVLQQLSDGRTSQDIYRVLTKKRVCPNTNFIYNDVDDFAFGRKHNNFVTGNRIFLSRDAAPTFPEMAKNLREKFHTEVKYVDFKQGERAIGNDISKWITRITNGKVNDQFEAHFLRNSSLVLFSFAFFEANWYHQFRRNADLMDFFNIDGSVSPVVSMTAKGDFLVAPLRDIGATAVMLPFGTGSLHMLLILPERVDRDSIRSFQDHLCSFTVSEIIQRGTQSVTRLEVPIFKLQMEIDLQDMFNREQLASVIGPNSNYQRLNGQRDVRLSSLKHSARITVDESGSRANSMGTFAIQQGYQATRQSRGGFEGGFEPLVDYNIAFNKPFIFYIYDSDMDFVSLMGRVIQM